jgi:hypothetical protein
MDTRAARSINPRECDGHVSESTNLLHSAENRLSDLRKETLREAERALAIEIVKAIRRIHVLLHDHQARSNNAPQPNTYSNGSTSQPSR